ncbi:unconventional myosin-ixb [Limosa lapponica baueri]|uniref:Unconventional myosin-ixb n=1 Tax=Limosa lapponica baueri TaxID=1758121 RepID=A0A2I0TB22_LIMLA|nr:unconventional myosin-ixb [Limosa lapponica baueri]
MKQGNFRAGEWVFTVLDLYQFQNEQDAEPRHFGVCVSSLTSERNSVPIVMEKLLEYVEMHGLYTEGIYRKSGSANRMKELKQLLQAEMLIKEQIRKYKIKMDEINQLEAAESIAFRRLSLLRQNTSKSSQVKGSESGNSELDSLREEEEVSEADNREKEILIDRIQSIKEEKEDITYRLPELDQRGSDEENVDSETSVSTESLLEDRTGRMDTEAIIGLHCGARSSSMPAKDTCKVPSLLQSSSSSSFASLPSRHRSFLTLPKMKVPRRTPVMPTANIKLPPGIFKCTESQGRIPANEESQLTVRRREQPARRTDKIHSVYIAQGSALARAQELLDEYEPTVKVKRRFSDPFSHIPCIEK